MISFMLLLDSYLYLNVQLLLLLGSSKYSIFHFMSSNILYYLWNRYYNLKNKINSIIYVKQYLIY